ncbi:hypothetical protein GQX74_002619 [Glossina fuscipes]|nr:hypothetical protein GQX74_002619 [Glossina fuscipes]
MIGCNAFRKGQAIIPLPSTICGFPGGFSLIVSHIVFYFYIPADKNFYYYVFAISINIAFIPKWLCTLFTYYYVNRTMMITMITYCNKTNEKTEIVLRRLLNTHQHTRLRSHLYTYLILNQISSLLIEISSFPDDDYRYLLELAFNA